MKMIKSSPYIFVVLIMPVLLVPGKLISQTKTATAHEDTAHLYSNELQLVIANNESFGSVHKAGYNGIAELYNTNDPHRNLFVSNYAGLNFEHIFNGDSSSYQWNMFEPRLSPIEVVKLSDTKTELRQSRTKNWPLKSTITYEVKANSIDFVFTGVPIEDAWKKYGYIGIFFASYINEPEHKGINFIGHSNAGKEDIKPHWIYHLPERHGLQANQRPSGSNWNPKLDTSRFPISLVSGISDIEYDYPFYYGLSGKNVFILMFENPVKMLKSALLNHPMAAGIKILHGILFFTKKNIRLVRVLHFVAVRCTKSLREKMM